MTDKLVSELAAKTSIAATDDLYFERSLQGYRIPASDLANSLPVLVGIFNVKNYGATVSGGAAANTTAIQAAIDAAETAGGGIVFIPPENISYIQASLTFPLSVTLLDLSNPDSAAPMQFVSNIPSTVDMAGGAAVEGSHIISKFDTSAATPNAGLAETNAFRIDMDVNSDAGSKIQINGINVLLKIAHDAAGDGTEHAVIIGTARATGPTSGTAAAGVWGGDFHAEKVASVLDGSVVGLEVGVHKAPALSTAKNRGIDIWSGDRSGITASRGGDALYVHGDRGWTNFLKFVNTDESTEILSVDQNGNLTITAPTGNFTALFQTNANSTTGKIQTTGKTSGGVSVGGVLQAEAGGQVTFGAISNHHLVVIQNSSEVIRFISGFLYSSPSGVESTGAGSAALSTNCPAVTASAPFTWVKARTSDGSTVYFPVWK